jgi:hypothetical protein
LQSGCYYVKVSPTADIKSIKTVAISKFASLAFFRGADKIMPQAFEEAFKQNGFAVIGSQKLSDAVGEIIPDLVGVGSSDSPGLNSVVLKKIHNETGTDAIFIGHIRDFGYHSREFGDMQFGSGADASYARIVLDFQLLDTRFGEVIMHGRVIKTDGSLPTIASKMADELIGKLKESRATLK